VATIVATERLTPVTKLFRIEAPLIAAAAHPGQFVMLRVREGGERIPISIADFDRGTGLITIVVQEAGATTKRLCALEAGDQILDLAGPLGTPLELAPRGHIVAVGGGFGSAPLVPIIRELVQRGDRVTALVGARTADLVILRDRLRQVASALEVCTDDGSLGFHGFVTARLTQLIAGEGPGRPDAVIAIGPMVMMRAVAELTRGPGIPTVVSLDPLMIDGTGMCGGCRVSVGGHTKFACVDGPCFDAHQVDFALAIRRNKRYREQEKAALESLACAAGAA
jgi:ferredoxin/flavodoxin---NADP+ reductase